MSNRFLAEDFRKLLNELDRLLDAKNDNSSLHYSIDDIMKSPRPKNIKRKSVTNVMHLIQYLDQFSELANYRNLNAKYDEAYYVNLPADKISQVAKLSVNDLRKILKNTKKFEGHIWMKNGLIDIFGKC